VQSHLKAIVLDDDEVEKKFGPLREMCLEIEDMSYEKFFALCERVFNVSNGLSVETITAPLEIKVYTPNPGSINLEEFPYDIQEIDICIIFQT